MARRYPSLLLSCAVAALAAGTTGARAQSAAPAPAPTAATQPFDDTFWTRDKLFGDAAGLRPLLDKYGIKLDGDEWSEVFGNATGGVRRGAIYEGSTYLTLGIDTSKLLNWKDGGKIAVSAFQIHGRGLSSHNLDNLNVVSSVEAQPTARLFELWYEQTFFDNRTSLRIGQMGADQEFMTSLYAPLFINAGFGWPTLAAIDLPEGGPAYPLATPGVRLRQAVNDKLAFQAGVYNGNPADNGSGTSFAVNKGVLAIAELQLATNAEEHALGLPGAYKVGAWYNSNSFADPRYDSDGLSLADPASNGIAAAHRGDWSVYAVAQQMLYKVQGTQDQGLGVFARMMGAPDDRNVVDFFIDAGATYKGPFSFRPDDQLGVGVLFAKISGAASEADLDQAAFSGAPYPVRSAETAIEATYQIQLAPWWNLQPDFQYVFKPGGSIPNPNMPAQTIGNEAIFGLRTAITF